MRTLHLSEPLLRDLVARYPFYEIARMYKCDARMVGALAAKYGLASAFVAKAGPEEEKVRIRELAAEGMPIKRIALAIGRSQDFVARRLKTMDEDDDDDWLEEAWSSEGWPRPDTACAESSRRLRSFQAGSVLRKMPGTVWRPYQPTPKPSPFVVSAPMRECLLCTTSEFWGL